MHLHSTKYAILAIAILAVGCSHGSATMQGRHTTGQYETSGDDSTLGLADRQTNFEVQTTYAQRHVGCMDARSCWGYGGGLGTDLELNYANVGQVGGQQQTAPQGTSAPAVQTTAVDLCARERSADALRILRAQERGEEPVLKGAPHCKEGGAQ